MRNKCPCKFFRSGSDGSGIGESGYWVFAALALIAIIALCYYCARRKSENDQPPSMSKTVTNNTPNDQGKTAYNIPIQNNNTAYNNSIQKNNSVYNIPIQSNQFKVQERKVPDSRVLGRCGHSTTIQNNEQMKEIKLSDCKVTMPLSGERGHNGRRNNVYLQHVQNSVTPVKHQESQRQARKKPDVFIL